MTEPRKNESVDLCHIYTPLDQETLTIERLSQKLLSHLGQHANQIPAFFGLTGILILGQREGWIEEVQLGEFHIDIQKKEYERLGVFSELFRQPPKTNP